MQRGDCLIAAMEAVVGPRHETHGDATQSFVPIAAAWSGVAGVEIEPWQVCLMLAHMKLCRITTGDSDHVDHYMDAAGYIALAVELKTEGKQADGKLF